MNEFEKAGFTMLPSELVRPYRVAEAPAQLECKVVEIKPLGNKGGAGQLIFAQVLRMHVNRAVLDANNQIDPHKIDLVARMGGNFYARASGNAVFEVEKPLEQLGIGIDGLPAHIRDSHVLTGNELGRLGNVAALPSVDEVAAWWQAQGSAFAGQDLMAAARAALAGGDKVTALHLLMKLGS